jgi:SAM-dependent methyltransferase
LNDLGRLDTQISESDLARLLALRGDEDILDLGSGTGFYTDRMAALTSGLVYAVEIKPELNAHYLERGLPANVRLVPGDITALSVRPKSASASRKEAGPALTEASVDIACTIATWHEIEGRLDLPGVASVLRPRGRLLVMDWRKDTEPAEVGPPLAIRYAGDEVADSLASHFTVRSVENLGRSMFAVTSRKE